MERATNRVKTGWLRQNSGRNSITGENIGEHGLKQKVLISKP